MNDQPRCRYIASDQPRVLPGRHRDECQDEQCGGCLPCPMDHCRVCGVTHSVGACANCVAEVRDNLGEIRRMCDELPEEAEVRGVEGEAMALLGPATDPEAWGHRMASALAGRIDATYLETADDERHPLWVTATWAMVYRDAFDHDEPSGRVVLGEEVGYLERNLSYAANHEHVPFEDFARDLRQCVGHLDVVLHDSDRGERTNIDCLECKAPLERRLGAAGFEDVATCRGCGRRYTAAEYNFAVKADLIANAEWLTDEDMTLRTRVAAATVRSWARTPKDDSPPLVRKDTQLGRTVYSVADVERVRDEKGLAPCA